MSYYGSKRHITSTSDGVTVLECSGQLHAAAHASTHTTHAAHAAHTAHAATHSTHAAHKGPPHIFRVES